MTTSRIISIFISVIVVVYIIFATIGPNSWYGTPYIAALFLVVTVLILWPLRPYTDFYWRKIGTNLSISAVLALIFAIISSQLILISVFDLTGYNNNILPEIIFYVSWGGVPVIFIANKWIKLPQKITSPPPLSTTIVTILSTAFCIVISRITSVFAHEMHILHFTNFLIQVLDIIIAAGIEEVVFRLILLTAILELSKSRLEALVISSFVFAILHVPVILSGMIVTGEWNELTEYSRDLFPRMNYLLGIGFILGAVWLRTGSLILIIFLHSLLNLGIFLSSELDSIAT